MKEVAEGVSSADKPRPVAAEPQEEVAAKQEGETAEKPGSEAELSPGATERGGGPSPMTAESIPRQPPAEPREPEPQEDAGDHAALPSRAEGEDLDSDKEELVVREPASPAATPAPVTSTAASFESSEGFEWLSWVQQ
ncbi:hypothetical protein AAES_152837 [Amazona aestiva]|uniref:Uncharacterized protein n=1 Tax=Amazona aestiva TaxID=12930 RepID=A0A0Q3LWG3_AMAAE|nr:hypothetical protein AAES_152837 [Amazona aestiva]